ncbi:hypothetical protein LP419_28620 [Massilia sp. H-1]|nr:hypothetical protein LP419_28620 [Massilia sp. H-1]
MPTLRLRHQHQPSQQHHRPSLSVGAMVSIGLALATVAAAASDNSTTTTHATTTHH